MSEQWRKEQERRELAQEFGGPDMQKESPVSVYEVREGYPESTFEYADINGKTFTKTFQAPKVRQYTILGRFTSQETARRVMQDYHMLAEMYFTNGAAMVLIASNCKQPGPLLQKKAAPLFGNIRFGKAEKK